MNLTFLLILLLVFAVVFGNIALLRYYNKPMQTRKKTPPGSSDAAKDSGKSQAALTSAMPLTTKSQTVEADGTAHHLPTHQHNASKLSPDNHHSGSAQD